MSANRSHSRPLSRWWLGGRETCDFCLQLYVLEMETRCAQCDRSVCPMCVTEVQASHLLLCPECDGGGEDPDGG